MNGLKILGVFALCLSIAFGLGTLTNGMNSETTVALPLSPPSVAPTQTPQPASDAEATQPTVKGNATMPEDGEQFEDVTTNEVEYVRECQKDAYGNVVSCRVVPRVRQVTRRVAVKTAKAVANVAATVADVATPFRTSSGGSTGTYVSYPVADAYDDQVSYGSTGSANVSSSSRYFVRSRPVLFDGPIARMVRRRR